MKKALLILAIALLLTSCSKDTAGTPMEENEIKSKGTYTFTGLTAPITVNAGKNDAVELILNDVEINCDGRAAINIVEADKVIITLLDGSENIFTVSGAFDENDSANAAIFSKSDLVFSGGGSLTINNPYGHGVEGNDGIEIIGGNYTVSASGHGFEANDYISVTDGSFNITSKKDGFHAENTDDSQKGYITVKNGSFNIFSSLDGISASSYVTLEGGSFDITAGSGDNADLPDMGQMPELPEGMEMPDMGQMPELPEGMEMPERGQMPEGMERPDRGQMGGGRGQGGIRPDMQWDTQINADSNTDSMKGIKVGGVLTVNGGTYTINSEDDCLHSNSDIKVTGGAFTLSTGDDAFHADANLSFTDGSITVNSSYEALEGESIDIHGGVFVTVSSDDGLNAAGGADSSGFGFRGDMFGSADSYINITGGDLTLNANGDGIDSNGSLSVSGGTVTVLGPLSGGDAPVDWQISGDISGGTVVAVGNSSMASNFDTATQGSVFLVLDSYVDGGKTVQVTDNEGNLIIETTIDKSYNCILISTPELKENGTYTVTADGTEYPVTLDGFTYSNRSGGGFGGFGGFGGGGRPKGNRDNNV